MTFARGHQGDDVLHLSQDRKVSPLGTFLPATDRWKARWLPTIPNSFGLPAGRTCPGATAFCGACYGRNAEKYDATAALLAHNLRLLTEARTVPAMAGLLDEMVGRCVLELRRHGVPVHEWVFRIHWDGDFFSVDYAEAWRQVVHAHPEVTFWAYTRSFRPPVDVVPVLRKCSNLALYLSVDEHNAKDATTLHPEQPVAWCAEDYRTARSLARSYRREAIVCPENAGRIPLMSEGRGACVECAVCPQARRDILFSTSHREDRRAAVRQPKPTPTGSTQVGPTSARTLALVCDWCHGEFSRPSNARGPKPRFCSRECQVAAYEARRVS